MNIIELPIRRATDIAVLTTPATRAARNLVTQYWRRTNLLSLPGARPDAVSVFDESIVRALAALKQHLIHAPEIEPACLEAIAIAGQEVLHEPSRIFAQACLHVLHLQQRHADHNAASLFGPCLEAQPSAVFDALRFGFDSNVGEFLATQITDPQSTLPHTMAHLLMRLAISRPAVSDRFAASAAKWVAPRPGGLAALAGWRCTGRGDEAKALAAVQSGDDPQAALITLALLGSPQEQASAHAVLAKMPQSAVALALLAAHDGYALAQSLREGQHPQMPWNHQVYGASLVGDTPLLRHLASHAPWNDETACRTIADATALLTGTMADEAYDMARDPAERAAHIDGALAALPAAKTPMRLGRPRDQAVLEDAAPLVGAPLRDLLYIEHTSRVSAALWIEADDLAMVQAMACTTASMLERAAFNLGTPQP